MNQRELATALGIDEGLVSRLKARGMPVDSVHTAQDWRRRYVAPYYRSNKPPPPPARPEGEAQPPANGDILATVSAVEDVLRNSAVMSHAALLAVVDGLATAAVELLNAGRPLGSIEAALRASLAAVPSDRRDQVALPLRLYRALCAEVIEFVESRFASDEERELDRQALKAGGDAAAQEMGKVWYSVAAGEIVVPK